MGGCKSEDEQVKDGGEGRVGKSGGGFGEASKRFERFD
jgi:hypothetical protein